MPRKIQRKVPRQKSKPLTQIRKGVRDTQSAKKYFDNRVRRRRANMAQAATKITTSPHKSIMIPYLTRIMAAKKEGDRLTSQQRRIATAFTAHTSADTVLNRFNDLPANVGSAFDKKVFTLRTASDVDKYVSDRIVEAAEKVESKVSSSSSNAYRLEGFRGIDFEGIGALKDWSDYNNNPTPEPCPNLYQLRLEYRGITTLKTADRSGGVEPYLMTAFCRVPFGTITGAIHTMGKPATVKQYPKGLHNMSPGEWMPSGGADENGNPLRPFQFFPLITTNHTAEVHGMEIPYSVDGWQTPNDWSPVLLGRDLHCALISVWEEDGDQSAELLSNMGSAVAAIGGMIANPLVGGVIIVVGLVLELASFLTGEDDDPIGDQVLFFGEQDLQRIGYTERPFTTTSRDGNNRWRIYIGAESQKLSA